MVPINTNHCVRSTTKEWAPFKRITAVKSKTLEWFLHIPIIDVSEAQVWNGSDTHQSLMRTIMEWFLCTPITAARSTIMECFLHTPITDVSEVQLWNGSYTHQSLMCQKHKYVTVPTHTNH